MSAQMFVSIGPNDGDLEIIVGSGELFRVGVAVQAEGSPLFSIDGSALCSLVTLGLWHTAGIVPENVQANDPDPANFVDLFVPAEQESEDGITIVNDINPGADDTEGRASIMYAAGRILVNGAPSNIRIQGVRTMVVDTFWRATESGTIQMRGTLWSSLGARIPFIDPAIPELIVNVA